MRIVDCIDIFDVERQKKDKDGYIEHLHCEGSRRHVIFWDTNGEHCSEKNCEVNRNNSIPFSSENEFIYD
ncbi:hypothetical protein K9M42_02575 [Patescibacteria group bacterium]|nr:hypothetical protein [Patescibacteria group bacterium]